ncbi:transposase [Streptomyces sp. NPDC058441]|uniref:transposase n=1 Tax=Streptomyces sp. NPDC058441 TaxID=3346502 RepID=UPI00365F0628
MLDAVRYLIDNGIKWRAMPVDFPAWSAVYAFFRRWREHGLIAEFHHWLRARVRRLEGRDTEPTAAIVDSQSVRATETVGASTLGWDNGKKVGGRKRHIAVDCLGMLLVVLVTSASVQDRDAGMPLLGQLRPLHRRSHSCGPTAAIPAARRLTTNVCP